jgi:hypothetical protein
VPADPPGGPRRRAASSQRASAAAASEVEAGGKQLPRALRPVSSGVALPIPSSLDSAGARKSSARRVPFSDDFSRPSLGASYRATSEAWRIDAGRLCVRGAHNHPLWVLWPLPTNARIEFDAEAASDDGDIKVEAWGDGRSAATTVSYSHATSYVFILGGWKNSLHALARLDEHGRGRAELRVDPEANDPRRAPVEAGRTYHFVLERRNGHAVRFLVDDNEILTFYDDEPLAGESHAHFAFNDWESPVCFDNLTIFPLEG